jgi:hypothetical protein
MTYTITIQNDAILNNYIQLIQLLCVNNNITLIVEKDVVKTEDLLALPNTTIYEYKIQQSLVFWEDVFNYVFIGRKKNTSISFEERFNWRIKKFSDFRNDSNDKSFRNYFYRVRRYCVKHKDVIIIKVLLKTKLDVVLRPFFYKIFRVEDYHQALIKIPIDSIIIVPYWGINVECNFLLSEINKQKNKKFKSLFIQENWDNLSSKSLMFYKPNVLTVWGEQTKRHAIDIQSMSEKNLKYLQSPRYISFYEDWQKQRNVQLKSQNLTQRKIILYIGDSTDADEVEIITLLSGFLTEENLDYEILYRPHPFQKGKYKRKFTKNAIPSNVRLDEEFLEVYFNEKRNLSTKSDQGILLKNLLLSDAIICGGSTSFLEALLTCKPILLINGRIRSTTILKKEHFSGVENLDYVDIVNEGEIGNGQLKRFFDKVENFQMEGLDLGKIDFYFNLGEQSYYTRFLEIVEFTANQ